MDDGDDAHLDLMTSDSRLDLGNMNVDPTSTWMCRDADPRLEDLVGDFSAPIVELTTLDLTELKDVDMDEPDFNLLEPAVQISSSPIAPDNEDVANANDDEPVVNVSNDADEENPIANDDEPVANVSNDVDEDVANDDEPIANVSNDADEDVANDDEPIANVSNDADEDVANDDEPVANISNDVDEDVANDDEPVANVSNDADEDGPVVAEDCPAVTEDCDVSEDSFCMIEPEVQINSPDRRSPDACDYSSDIQECSPAARRESPEVHDISEAPDLSPRSESPQVQYLGTDSPEVRIYTPEPAAQPELFTIDDSPEKTTVVTNMELAVLKKYSEFKLRKLEIHLVRVDKTLKMSGDSVTLPSGMAGESRRGSSTIPRGSKAKARHDRATTAPYSLRVKPDAPTETTEVRYNPYALAAQKNAKPRPARKRSAKADGSAKESDSDFSPMDFLEATMEVDGDSPVKSQPWRNSDGTVAPSLKLLSKEVVLLRKPNGTAGPSNVRVEKKPVGGRTIVVGNLGNPSVQSIMAKSDSVAEKEMLTKVLQNSSISLTAQRSKLAMAIESAPRASIGNKKPSPTKPVMNNDNQYSAASGRLSNANVTRLETEVASLRAQVHVLQTKLAAANNYIVTSLQSPTSFKPAPPLVVYRPNVQPRAAVRQQRPAAPFVSPARGLVPFRGRGQMNQGQATANHGQNRPRQMAPSRGRGTQQRPLLPAFGTRTSPARNVRPMTVFPLRSSTQALTVIPVPGSRKSTYVRPREPDVVLPAFEQVNVNERFGTHFLTE